MSIETGEDHKHRVEENQGDELVVRLESVEKKDISPSKLRPWLQTQKKHS
jgi:hypothetical protein